MSKISKEGYEQIQIIKNALDSMYDKLNKNVLVPKGKVTKNVESNFESKNPFNEVQSEFEAIAGIVAMSDTWSEVE
jgi:hypothetical protein